MMSTLLVLCVSRIDIPMSNCTLFYEQSINVTQIVKNVMQLLGSTALLVNCQVIAMLRPVVNVNG